MIKARRGAVKSGNPGNPMKKAQKVLESTTPHL
jgi:hypothetical protein